RSSGAHWPRGDDARQRRQPSDQPPPSEHFDDETEHDAMMLILLVLGLGLLIGGVELILRGASRLAVRLGLSPLVVGMTVVAFSTNSPELVVSLDATLN